MQEYSSTGEFVEELKPGDAGRWLVTTQGSEHSWDLDEMTYARFPTVESKSGATEFDTATMRINRVQWWPKVGERPWVWFDDPNAPLFYEHYRVNSVVRFIERLSDDSAEVPALKRPSKAA